MDLKGNSEVFKAMPGGDVADIVLEDDTKLGWTGSAQEIILCMLIEEFNKTKSHPILSA